MAQTPEGKIKAKVKSMLQKHGIWYFLPANNGFGRSGVPDFVCCVSGRFVGIECKADAARSPTALQMVCAGQITDAGGRWLLVYDDETLREAETVVLAFKKIFK